MSKELALVETVCKSPDPIQTADDEIAEFEALEIEDLCHLRSKLETVLTAAKLLKRAVDTRLYSELGHNAEIRVGDHVFRARPGQRYKLRDTKEFCEWAGEDLKDVVNVTSAVRVTMLRQLAERRGLDPRVVLDTFGGYEEDGQLVSVVPINRAPKYLQRLKDGQRTVPKGELLGSS